jgi:hypothetical protein
MALADASCLQCGAPAPQAGAALAWRKKGIALEKQGELARAGQAFQSALALDDADEIAHQLFIANLGKQGLLFEAADFYKRRLEADPSDAMALKQQGVIKLSADFLSQPAPVLKSLGPPNLIERWLAPSPWKIAVNALSLLACLGMAVVSALHGHGAGGASVMSMAGVGDLQGLPDVDSMLYDVNAWSLSAGLNGLILFFMYRNRKP